MTTLFSKNYSFPIFETTKEKGLSITHIFDKEKFVNELVSFVNKYSESNIKDEYNLGFWEIKVHYYNCEYNKELINKIIENAVLKEIKKSWKCPLMKSFQVTTEVTDSDEHYDSINVSIVFIENDEWGQYTDEKRFNEQQQLIFHHD